MEDKKIYVECACSSIDHLIRITSCKNENPEDDDLIIEVQLNNKFGFFRRVFTALKYVFKCDYNSNWGECLVEKKQVDEIINVLLDFKNVNVGKNK